jgi:Tfp pilus assembly protein PilO
MTISWPVAIIIIFVIFMAVVVYGGAKDRHFKLQKAQITADREQELRQLVTRYEQLAETTLDAQQRVAADVSELRSRTSSIEQILRTVE